MSVFYEWDVELQTAVETAEHEENEVIDHHHFDTYAECLAYVDDGDAGEGLKYAVVLVRDDDVRSVRAWAYVEDGALPTHFADAWDRPTAKVPQRFHDEVTKAKA